MIKLKACTHCKIKKRTSEFHKNKVKEDGFQNECKSCTSKRMIESYHKDKSKYREKSSKWYRNNKDKVKVRNKQYRKKYKKRLALNKSKYNKTLKGRYLAYRHGAKQRNIKWNLSLEEFQIFWKKPCYYCNASITTIGLDRINSNKKIGYIINNVVPCCETCNDMKCQLSIEDFTAHCNKVVKNMKQKKSKGEELENAEQNNNVQSNT